MARNAARGGHIQHTCYRLGTARANDDLVSGLHGMAGLGRTLIDKDKTRVAELLSYCPARAQTTEFEK